MNNSKGIIGLIITFFLIICMFIAAFSGGGSSSSGKSWGDLNDQERANAKWAYEAQQAIDNMN